ncbi:MAG TPA: 2-nitropropane dioxygenase [Bdellovibrionales bacterium]|nr:MAG: 2-nitropropane dioxygenase [Bdellovibrionales bacterium GWB1_52_6]OFZ04565.1 MAG: 2-nitropropane dioxygenase [Bdellovibrionales bacterium GWA1_52_35]OFZ42944.1 MAG: 2-nitropropane dioxygenase [Bdellovibrionales bacterium GWC1_52_8]HAR43640.1 2-nitropropane dioxygenase [Bdellovibrionales bacterium]HCM39976.1 2-nitropropane dioxygenase [Bdellovibrionales bacterium]
MKPVETAFTKLLGIEVPVICGAMFPCSNVELVAAVSEAGGIGIVQPISLVYVYGEDFRAGLRRIRSLTTKPIGMNVLVEKSSKVYENRMRGWVDIALEEGVRFFVTALGNPSWVVARTEQCGGTVFHNITEEKWAIRALDYGVHGLNCVNDRAGGHAGVRSAEELLSSLKNKYPQTPLICAGGVGDETAFVRALQLGYDGVQMGTRFIATTECGSHVTYKEAIVHAKEEDIVLTDRVTGIPLSVIRTPYVQEIGTRAGPFARFLLRNERTKHLMRLFYTLQSGWKLKRSSLRGLSSKDYWQAGKSVAGVNQIESAHAIVRRFAEAATRAF